MNERGKKSFAQKIHENVGREDFQHNFMENVNLTFGTDGILKQDNFRSHKKNQRKISKPSRDDFIQEYRYNLHNECSKWCTCLSIFYLNCKFLFIHLLHGAECLESLEF